MFFVGHTHRQSAAGLGGVVVCVLLLAVSCGEDTAETCLTRADCQDGQICVNGGCAGAVTDVGIADVGISDGSALDGESDAGLDVDPCSAGPDSDGDGVVDACDVCPGFDDLEDDDDDGTADGCDDWPCGTRPVVPLSVSADSIVVTNVELAEMGNTAVFRPAEIFELEFDWALNDEVCPACIDQVEIGFTRTGRFRCVYDGNPPLDGTTGNARVPGISLPPDALGLYELRFALGQAFSCGDNEDWARGEPADDQTVGVVCVPPPGIETPP